MNNSYEPLKSENIILPEVPEGSIPYVTSTLVETYIKNIKTKPSTPPGDIPALLVKRFSNYLSKPLTHIINSCLKRGEWPTLWKVEAITPVPKIIPPLKMNKLRPISGLKVFNKIAEKIVADMMIEDMKEQIDISQFGNQKGLSIQHYLVKMIYMILSHLDNSSKGEVSAVIASLVD